jgi:hypothetical protein
MPVVSPKNGLKRGNPMLTIKLLPLNRWGHDNTIAVHQQYDEPRDLDDAVYQADRDGFECVVLYAELHLLRMIADEVADAQPDAEIVMGRTLRLVG